MTSVRFLPYVQGPVCPPELALFFLTGVAGVVMAKHVDVFQNRCDSVVVEAGGRCDGSGCDV